MAVSRHRLGNPFLTELTRLGRLIKSMDVGLASIDPGKTEIGGTAQALVQVGNGGK